jgi:hypothetical protein
MNASLSTVVEIHMLDYMVSNVQLQVALPQYCPGRTAETEEAEEAEEA